SDLPLLEMVGHPVAVNPDATLRRIARERNWPVVSFARKAKLTATAVGSGVAVAGLGAGLYALGRVHGRRQAGGSRNRRPTGQTDTLRRRIPQRRTVRGAAVAEASAPASSANLGPGFDVLALALGLRCLVVADISDTWSIDHGEGQAPDADSDDAVLAAARAAVGEDRPLALKVDNEIPIGRG